jgi:parallel beta-helix repeat protein
MGRHNDTITRKVPTVIERKATGKVNEMKQYKATAVALAFLMLMSATASGILRAEDMGAEVNGYIVREPIRINGDSDFAAQAAAEGWPGDGGEGDPYIIGGYEIDGANYEHCILINNTNIYFELKGNYVHGSKYGISFEMVQNAIIKDNRLSNNNYSIKFAHSNRNIISNNTITDNVWIGIYLIMSSNNTVSSNNVSNQKYGVAISYCNENVIVNNTISNSSEVGVIVTEDGTLIHNNDIRDNIYINNTLNYDVQMTVTGENGVGSSGIPTPYIILALALVAIFATTLVIWKRKKSNRGGE